MGVFVLVLGVLAGEASSLLQRVTPRPDLSPSDMVSGVSLFSFPDIDLERTLGGDTWWRPPAMLVDNLGGMGPDVDRTQAIRIANAVKYDGKNVDVIIEALTPYSGNVSQNRLDGMFVQLNLAAGSDVKLKMSLVETGTWKPVTLNRFALSVLDLGAGMDDGQVNGYGSVLAGPLYSYSVTESTELVSRYANYTDDYVIFNFSKVGHMYDTPKPGEPVTEQQKNRAVIMEFVSSAKLRLHLFASPASEGRTFLIGGSHIFGGGFNKTKTGPCTHHRHLELSSVMVTDNAVDGMRFLNVFPHDSQDVDLLVHADGRHRAWDANRNGLRGTCGVVNLAGGSSTVFTFSFLHSKTNAPVQVGKFFFSLLGLDSRHGLKTIKINATEWSRFWVTNASIVQGKAGDLHEFQPIAIGTDQENPLDPTGVDLDPMSESVTLFMRDATNEFKILFEASPHTLTEHNFLFSGRTSYVCPDV